MKINTLTKTGWLTIFVTCFLFLSAAGPDETYNNGSSPRSVLLQKDARANGYKITEKEGVFYVQAVKVKDPVTRKLLEEVKRLQYRCSQNGPVISTDLIFNKGNSSRTSVSCALLIEPRIILEDL